jgi:hypothetical protein
VGNSLIYDSGSAIGIGIAAPTSLLHVSASGYPAITIQGGATAGGGLKFLAGTDTYAELFGEYQSANNGMLLFRTRGLGTVTERMRIASDGTKYLGAPTGSRLQIDAPGESIRSYTNNYYIYSLFNDSNSLSIESAFAGNIIFRTAAQGTSSSPGTAAERMRITAAGNVGIGTSTPSTLLHVSGGDLTISNTTTTAIRLNASSSSFQTSIYLQEAGVTRWEFGKLSTTPDFYVYGGNTPGFGLEIIFATRRLRLAAYGAGTLTTDASGNVTASSDSSLKNVIKPIKNVLENIKDFEPVYFKWNEKTDLDKENVYMSTIAQSIQKNYPEAVGKMEDGTLTVQDRAVTAILVAAIQELSAKITILENK